jgi:hypothetical protein
MEAATNSDIVQNSVKATSVAALSGNPTSATAHASNDIFNELLNIG